MMMSPRFVTHSYPIVTYRPFDTRSWY